MLATYEEKDEVRVPDYRPGDLGVFFLDEVVSYINATGGRYWPHGTPLLKDRVARWSKDSGLGLRTITHFGTRRRFLTFQAMISVRMMAILRHQGVPWQRVNTAHENARELLKDEFPFATEMFWDDAPELTRDVNTDFLDTLVGSVKGSTFAEMRSTLIDDAGGLEFESGSATLWRPFPYVWINPRFQGGVPCVDGRRVPTSVLRASIDAGLSVEHVAEDFEVKARQVRSAVAWEHRLDDVKAAARR